jgi:Uma2 family endonuclease
MRRCARAWHRCWVMPWTTVPNSVYTSDARMKLAEKRSLYPDVTVACEEQTGRLLTSPVVVIDVLSPTTEKRERGAKCTA